jgi:hypothetical protein
MRRAYFFNGFTFFDRIPRLKNYRNLLANRDIITFDGRDT